MDIQSTNPSDLPGANTSTRKTKQNKDPPYSVGTMKHLLAYGPSSTRRLLSQTLDPSKPKNFCCCRVCAPNKRWVTCARKTVSSGRKTMNNRKNGFVFCSVCVKTIFCTKRAKTGVQSRSDLKKMKKINIKNCFYYFFTTSAYDDDEKPNKRESDNFLYLNAVFLFSNIFK